jgi:anti-sigma B factor antagonist
VHGVTVESRSSLGVVRATGELDAFTAPDLERAFAEIVGFAKVVVDLERVSFLDSTALGEVVRCVRELRERQADVRVVLPRGTARRIFEITMLDRSLPVAESAAGAERELAS